MANVLNSRIPYWGTRLRNSTAAAFCRWWFGELKQALPAGWQRRLQHASRRVVLGLQGEQLRLGIDENQSINWLESVELHQDAPLQRQQIRGLLEKHDALEVSRFLLLQQADVLRKVLLLPAAAEPNLQQVLAFEMDRQTPFRASEVYYTWKMLGSDREAGQIQVELFVLPRKPLDATLETLAALGLAVSGVDVADGTDQARGINLLPVEKRFRVVNPQTRMNYALAGSALVLLIAVMAQSLNYRAKTVRALETAIENVRDEADRVQRLREQLKETAEAASFLTRRRAQSPMAIELMADVTKTLPDDTYLDRLVINQDGVVMQGKSGNAQQLIEVVNKSEIFDNAAFRGSTRLDATSGLEIFEISAQTKGEEKP